MEHTGIAPRSIYYKEHTMIRTKLYAAALLGVMVGLAGLALGASEGLHLLGQAVHPAGAAGYAAEVTQTPDPLWAASWALDDVLDQYPGAEPIGDPATDWHRVGQHLERQAEYLTPDPLAVVQAWYAVRLHVSPASDVYVTGADGCAFLSNTHPVLRADHTITVLMCAVPDHTRVAVTETLEQAP